MDLWVVFVLFQHKTIPNFTKRICGWILSPHAAGPVGFNEFILLITEHDAKCLGRLGQIAGLGVPVDLNEAVERIRHGQ